MIIEDDRRLPDLPLGSGGSLPLPLSDVTDFRPLGGTPVSQDPLGWPGYHDKLKAARQRSGAEQAVTAGRAVVGGEPCVLAAFRFDFLGGSMGEAEGELLVRAIDEARRDRLPLVTVGASGGARLQEGPVSLFQMPRLARALAALAAAGVPHVSVAQDPTTGGVWASLIAGADVVIGRAGAQVAFAGSRVLPASSDQLRSSTAEGQHAAGFVDVVAEEAALASTVAGYLRLLSPATRGEPADPPLPIVQPTPNRPSAGWDSVRAARGAGRRGSEEYLAEYLTEVMPVWGDRVGGVDEQIRCGFGRRDGRTIGFVCQRGGKVGAAGFRTASRLLALADRLAVPVVTFVDTSGADNSAQAERDGVGTAIAMLLRGVAACSVPILSVVVGQGVSGGAIALVNPENTWMTPDSYLAVISPEAASSILKQDPTDVPQLAGRLALTPTDLHRLGLTRGVLVPGTEPA